MQPITIKELLTNDICILKKQVHSNKKINVKNVCNFLQYNQCNLAEIKNIHSEENLNLKNELIEKQVTIHKLQNIKSFDINA